MIITISGLPGSGKSTVAQMLAKKLKLKYYSMGEIRRRMAVERGMSLEEFNALGERQAFTDVDVDRWQRKLGQTGDNMIIEGRTSFHFIPQSVKVFLDVDMAEAARRIFHDPKHLRRFEFKRVLANPSAVARALRRRVKSDTKRYQKYYGINIFLRQHYDLWIDSTKKRPQDVADVILSFLANNKPKSKVTNNSGTTTLVVHKSRSVKKKAAKAHKTTKVSKK